MSERQIRRAHERVAEKQGRGGQGLRPKLALASGAALGATVLFAPAAEAGTFVVTSTADDGSDGTLREEIEQANASDGDDTITFATGLTGTIDLSGTQSDIEIYFDGLDIQGPGAGAITVDGNDAYRIFDFYNFDAAGEQVSVSGLTLANGDTTEDGGAIRSFPSAFGEAADLTLDGVVITGSQADDGGGGVYSREGALTVANSVLSGNSSGDSGGGLYSRGDGLTITNSELSDNEADNTGGGFYSGGGSLTVSDSTLANNTAGGGGGALYVEYTADEGGVVIERSSVTGNSSGSRGGGMVAFAGSEGVVLDSSTFSANRAEYAGAFVLAGIDGPIDIRNSTVAGNTANEAVGGLVKTGLDEVPITIRNSTIFANTQSSESAFDEFGAGVHLRGNGGPEPDIVVATLSSTIVSGNEGGAGDLGQEYEKASFELGFSLVGDNGNASTAESPAGSNLLGVDPQLGPLAANGGATQTHAPLLTSPVLDHGIANGLTSDQRGVARTSDLALVPNGPGSDGTDIGSVEIQAAEVEAQCQATVVRRLAGTGGDDAVTGTDAPEALFGLAGNDSVSGAGGNDCVNGDEGRDNAKGGPGKDIVKGGAGKDKGSGGGGKDKVKGNAGKDNLKGGGGADKLSGAGGKDSLKGGGGKDRLKGGPGKDKLSGGGGKDRFNCGGGKDKVTAQEKDKVSASCEKVVEKG